MNWMTYRDDGQLSHNRHMCITIEPSIKFPPKGVPLVINVKFRTRTRGQRRRIVVIIILDSVWPLRHSSSLSLLLLLGPRSWFGALRFSPELLCTLLAVLVPFSPDPVSMVTKAGMVLVLRIVGDHLQTFRGLDVRIQKNEFSRSSDFIKIMW